MRCMLVRFCSFVCSLMTLIGVVASPASPASAQTSPPNLIQDGGFEQEGMGWEACGQVVLVDAQTSGPNVVYAGRYAVAMGAGADGSGCPSSPGLPTPKQILRQELSIPNDAPAVTVSFWFRAAAGTAVDVFLARGIYQFDPNLGGIKLATFSTDRPPGWQLYRAVLTEDQLARVRGQTLFFSIVIQGDTAIAPEAILLIDEVRVILADGRTQAAPLPPNLRGDGSRPLAFIRREGQNRWLYRMDTDGSNRQLIYRGLLNEARYPAWSPDGRRIAVVDHNLDPESGLIASAVTLLNADGSGVQQVHQTRSRKGSDCPFFGPGPEQPALIERANHLTWMPDNNRVAFTSVAYNRFCNNSIQGGTSNVLVTTDPPGAGFPPTVAESAMRPSSNRAGLILFDSFGGPRANGVWEVDTSSQPPRETQVLPSGSDSRPVWAPDGRRFAVVRDTVSPSADAAERVTAIMIYDRSDLNLPRQVLFADHGRSVSDLSWSPDGAYLVYTLERFDLQTDIWWLDVNSGATGPVTNDGVSFEAVWRPSGVVSGDKRVYVPLVAR